MDIRMGVYTITNVVNNKVYVGSTGSGFERRWMQHKAQLTTGRHTNDDLQRDWRAHGEPAFRFEVVENVSDPSLLLSRERYWTIEYIRAGECYNMPECNHSGKSDASMPVSILMDEAKALRDARLELELARNAYQNALRDLPDFHRDRATAKTKIAVWSLPMVLTIALATHYRVKKKGYTYTPWSIRGLSDPVEVGGELVCNLTQDQAQLMGDAFAILGLVDGRGHRKAGRWLPDTIDEVVQLVATNWQLFVQHMNKAT